MSNPALNDKVFAREIEANRQGNFTPGWGSPAQEVPADLFDPKQPGAPGQLGPTGGGPLGGGPVVVDGDTMRVSGVVSATSILLLILIVAAWFGWQSVDLGPKITQIDGTVTQDFALPPWIFLACIGGLVLAIVTVFKPRIARFSAPVYAAAQGLVVGAFSCAYEVQFNGIVIQAVMLTIGVFVAMLVMFATGAIKVTAKFRMCVIAATFAIFAVYLVNMIISFFGNGLSMVNDASVVGIGFSVVVVIVASLNLFLDFDFVQRGVAARAPRYMEWFAAFGLLITLIWLYLEILRLLGKLRSN